MTVQTTHRQEGRPVRTSRAHVAKLLSRYPDVSNTEREEILTFMKKGRHLDVGLLTANDNLRPQFDAFMVDHKRHFRLGVFDVLRVLALIAATLIVGWVLWELVRPASF